MTAQDIGGPSGKGGTPLEAAAELNIQPPLEGKAKVDYGTRNENSEAFEQVVLGESVASLPPATRLLFATELDDLIVLGIEDIEDVLIFAAKPPLLRKTSFDTDGEFIDGLKVEYTSNGTRTKTFEDARGGELILKEAVTPPYVVDEGIFVIEANATGVTSVTLQDLNINGREWKNILPAERYFQIVEINRDTFWGQEWDFSTNAQKLDGEGILLPKELIAKHHLMRGSYWDGLLVNPDAASADDETINDLTYTVDDYAPVLPDPEENEYTIRNVEIDPQSGQNTNETQDVIPRWWINITIIRAELSELGTGAFRTIPGDPAGAVQAVWQDRNDGAHAFAEAFA